MQYNITKKIEKLINAYHQLGNSSKALLKYGLIFSFILFAAGTIMLFLYTNVLPYDLYYDTLSKAIIKSSLTVALEVMVGSIVLDFIFKK